MSATEDKGKKIVGRKSARRGVRRPSCLFFTYHRNAHCRGTKHVLLTNRNTALAAANE